MGTQKMLKTWHNGTHLRNIQHKLNMEHGSDRIVYTNNMKHKGYGSHKMWETMKIKQQNMKPKEY